MALRERKDLRKGRSLTNVSAIPDSPSPLQNRKVGGIDQRFAPPSGSVSFRQPQTAAPDPFSGFGGGGGNFGADPYSSPPSAVYQPNTLDFDASSGAFPTPDTFNALTSRATGLPTQDRQESGSISRGDFAQGGNQTADGIAENVASKVLPFSGLPTGLREAFATRAQDDLLTGADTRVPQRIGNTLQMFREFLAKNQQFGRQSEVTTKSVPEFTTGIGTKAGGFDVTTRTEKEDPGAMLQLLMAGALDAYKTGDTHTGNVLTEVGRMLQEEVQANSSAVNARIGATKPDGRVAGANPAEKAYYDILTAVGKGDVEDRPAAEGILRQIEQSQLGGGGIEQSDVANIETYRKQLGASGIDVSSIGDREIAEMIARGRQERAKLLQGQQ